MKRVVIVQRRLTHYRLPLFERLREALRARDIVLDIVAGEGTPDEQAKRDGATLAWAKLVPTRYFLGGRLCWQSLGPRLMGADMVVVTQENKLLYNYLLLLAPRRFRLAFWGHGANLQSRKPRGLRERFKRWTTNRVDWWFAYTELSAALVRAAGFSGDRISVLNNAVDTTQLSRWRSEISPAETQALREALGFGDALAGVYVGSLYADKRLDFLLEAASAIRYRRPEFRLLIVGDGTERERVRRWCEAHPWARWVGPKFDREKVLHLSVAALMLSPGAVGLGVMDAFACGVPLVTTDCGNHGPEIAYLENFRNGLITENSVEAYTRAVIGLLDNHEAMNALRESCARSAVEYTLENMVLRYCAGIEAVLNET